MIRGGRTADVEPEREIQDEGQRSHGDCLRANLDRDRRTVCAMNAAMPTPTNEKWSVGCVNLAIETLPLGVADPPLRLLFNGD